MPDVPPASWRYCESSDNSRLEAEYTNHGVLVWLPYSLAYTWQMVQGLIPSGRFRDFYTHEDRSS